MVDVVTHTPTDVLDEPIIGTVYLPEFSSGRPKHSSVLCVTASRRVLALMHWPEPDSVELMYDEVVNEQGRQAVLRIFDERNNQG